MAEVFLKVVNMSISAGWLVLAVWLVRFVLKKAPRWVSVLLWGMVAVRLICPFSLESVLSLIPSVETISSDIMMDPSPAIHSGVLILNNSVNPIISEVFTPDPGASANPLQIWIPVASAIWILGTVLMLIYAAVSCFRLHRRISTAVRLQDNIYQSEYVEFPFVMGIFRPVIYLPFTLGGKELTYVIAHEQAHIRRRDHWWKPVGFLLLSIYWFHPLMWAAYVFLCRDIELACDEKVIKELGREQRADYSQALLSCSVKRSMITACPLAFGEVGVKMRVRRVLSYKKPALWAAAAASVLCVIMAVCFLTDPVKRVEAAGVNIDNEGGRELRVTADTENTRSMTLQDVIELAKKGDDLRWDDFSGYTCEVTGSGLYICIYDINEEFSLVVSFSKPGGRPMYLNLNAKEWNTYIDICKEEILCFINEYQAEELEAAVESAVLAYNNASHLEGTVQVEAHEVLETEINDSGDSITLYMLTMFHAYSPYRGGEEGIVLEGGNYIPAALTFSIQGNEYVLDEYWIPRDGSDYDDDIYDRFPKAAAHAVFNEHNYVENLAEICEQKALHAMTESGSFEDEMANLFETIMSSPVTSSNPYEYIKAHPAEYEKLVGYGKYSLSYCYEQFLWGGQNGLKGHIMAAVCQEIAGNWGEALLIEYDYEYGQEWFDLFRENAKRLAEQYEEEELQKYYPASWQLLELTEIMMIPIKHYVFEESEDFMKPAVTLMEDGRFSFMFSMISSYIGIGTYEIKDDRLTLHTDDGKFVYVFDIVEDTIVFDAEASSELVWFSGLYDGAVMR